MNKFLNCLLIVFILFALGNTLTTYAAQESPFFLLGENEKAEIVGSYGKAVVLDLGLNPMEVITNKDGRKFFLCAGESNKTGGIIQGASVRLVSDDLVSYERVFALDSKLTAYLINKDATVLWMTTRGGVTNDVVVAPKLIRLDLISFAITESNLDSIPCEIAYSESSERLAVACLGEADQEESVVSIYETKDMKLLKTFGMPKNPGYLTFDADGTSLLAAGYGYRSDFSVPTEYFVKLKTPVSAGIAVINLITQKIDIIDLGPINQEFIIGRNTSIYGIVKNDKSGIVKAVGPNGLLWENNCDFNPEYVQERPDENQTFIMGEKKLRILQKDNGQTVKDLTLENDLKPFLFIGDSPFAYAYNTNVQRLNILNLQQLEMEKTLKAGSSFKAAMKVVAIGLSFVAYADSLQPHYVGNVRVYHHSSLYVPNAPRGSIVGYPEENKLFMLSAFLSEIYTYDMQKDVVEKKLSYLGEKTLYLQMAPNRKYIVLVSGDNWQLIDPKTAKSVLKFNPCGMTVRLVFQGITAPMPFYSPDGARMYIPKGTKVTVIDMENGKKLNDFKTEAKDALVSW